MGLQAFTQSPCGSFSLEVFNSTALIIPEEIKQVEYYIT